MKLVNMKAKSLFAPKAQQFEGLNCVLNRVGLDELKVALDNLVLEMYMSKSHKYRLLKLARHHYGLGYEESR